MQDPFDKQRIQALTEIKAESKAWIAAHAKGGSAPGNPTHPAQQPLKWHHTFFALMSPFFGSLVLQHHNAHLQSVLLQHSVPATGQAGKRMYVAVDAVLGHVNSNGAAPLPKQKVKFVAKTLEEVETLLSQGK